MNVYRCRYENKFGYSCRTHMGKWMFVPELGQADNIVHKNLSLDDLIFEHEHEKTFELNQHDSSFSLLKSLKALLFTRTASRSIVGLLLSND